MDGAGSHWVSAECVLSEVGGGALTDRRRKPKEGPGGECQQVTHRGQMASYRDTSKTRVRLRITQPHKNYHLPSPLKSDSTPE